MAIQGEQVDISLAEQGISSSSELAYRIHDALFKVGLAYIPMSPSLQNTDLLSHLKKFFAFSEKRKEALAQQLTEPWQGIFHPLGRERLADDQADHKEVLDLNLEHSTYAQWLRRSHRQQFHSFETLTAPENAFGDDQAFATLITSLEQIFHAFQEQANQVLAAIETVYQQPPQSLVKQHSQNSTLRLLHYPPAPHFELDSIRLGTHRDYSGITLLWQDSTGGLEILTPNHEWVAVEIPKGYLGVLAGEVMQQWSGETLHAAPHRVRIMNRQQLNQSRYSIAFFCETNHDCVVYPGSLVDAIEATNNEPIFIKEFLSSKYDRILAQASPSIEGTQMP